MQNKKTTSYKEATGVIQYNMTNDYMFRYILQKNEKVLRGLISSLLRLKPEQIKSIVITNPIDLAEEIIGKEFVLDINVMLNDNTLLNLEMQVLDKHNWKDRSLAYLCRSFDQLFRGQEYEEALPVTHIGFLDFTLFPEEPEFYATNMLMNIKTFKIYNDKFRLSVVDLSQIELANDEDKEWDLDYWARLFKAKTWEEIKMFAEKNEYLQEAAQSVYVANADEIVRQKCLAKEEAERHERTVQRDMKRLQEQLEQQRLAKEEAERHERTVQRDMKRLQEQLECANETAKKNHLVEQIKKKLQKGQTIEQIAESLEENMDVIEQLISEM